MYRFWISVGGGAVGGSIAGAIGWKLAGDDIQHIGDWRIGGARFIGFLVALGVAIGFLLTRRIASGKQHTVDGYSFSYTRVAPKSEGYREGRRVTVGDFAAILTRYGYEPIVSACDAYGDPQGPIELDAPLAGSNIGIRDPAVKGWVRVQLAPEELPSARHTGLIDTMTHRGASAEELALFTLKALDEVAGDLTASQRSSVLSQDAASLLTSGLPDAPAHRDGLHRLGAKR